MLSSKTNADFEKKLAKQRASQQRQRERQRQRQLEKMNDPDEIEKRFAKQRAAQARQTQRQLERQQEKLNDPVFQEQQLAKKREQAEKQRARLIANASKKKPKLKSLTSKVRKPIKSKGMKGRARTSEEKRLEDKLAQLGCICCYNKGWYTDSQRQTEHIKYISMHHVDGRTKPWCHAKQLPLCEYHHQVDPDFASAPKELFPIHGSIGKAEWEKVNGTQDSLLEQCYEMIGEAMPWLEPERKLGIN